MNTKMKLYEITYTDKYSCYAIERGESGLKKQYYVQDYSWDITQFDNCKIMEHLYNKHKLLSSTETQDLLWNGREGVVKLGGDYLELMQFDLLKERLLKVGFTLDQRIPPKRDYYLKPFLDRYLTPCKQYSVVIKKTDVWYTIYWSLTDNHPEYEIAKKYNGEITRTIGYWMFCGTIESNIEVRTPSEVYKLIINKLRKEKV